MGPNHCLRAAHARLYAKSGATYQRGLRGTFAGLASPQVLDYIKSLGVTSVELMPVHRFVSERALVDRGFSNYWGYNSIGFFALHPRYLADPANGISEFREMVARFHDAGLEVILDVVGRSGTTSFVMLSADTGEARRLRAPWRLVSAPQQT